MEANRFLLKASQGKKTTLDIAYCEHIKKVIEKLDEENESRWETYNIIIQELINDGKSNYFQEIKYRLTDGEDPNQVMLDVINREVDNVNGLIWFLKRRIEEYLEDDYFRRFYE